MKCKDTEDNNGIDFINIEGFAFFFYSDNVSQNQLWYLRRLCALNFQNDNLSGFFVTNNIQYM